LGSIETWAIEKQHTLRGTRFFENDPLPILSEIDWLIVMGGPMSVHDTDTYPWLKAEKDFIKQAVTYKKRVLGICLGAQLIATALGARVYPNAQKEIGWFSVERVIPTPFLPERVVAFHWHGETFDLPDGARHLARSTACEHQAFLYEQRVVGLQFHLEMTQTGVKQLIRYGREELVDAPHIQTAEAMLTDAQLFETTQRFMAILLDQLFLKG
jgi:GMP synthase (glutamine-hydrolysing)